MLSTKEINTLQTPAEYLLEKLKTKTKKMKHEPALNKALTPHIIITSELPDRSQRESALVYSSREKEPIWPKIPEREKRLECCFLTTPTNSARPPAVKQDAGTTNCAPDNF